MIDVIRGVEGAPGLDRVDVVQPVLWAVMVSLADIVALGGCGARRGDRSFGRVRSRRRVWRVGCRWRTLRGWWRLRSRLLVGLSGAGGMVSLACGASQAQELVAQDGDRLNIAAVNGVSAVVVSGEVAALQDLVRREADGVRARRIDVDYASHSAQVDAIREPLVEALPALSLNRRRWLSFRPLPVSSWTWPVWTPTTGIKVSGVLCSSIGRCAARATRGIGCSSNPVRIRS